MHNSYRSCITVILVAVGNFNKYCFAYCIFAHLSHNRSIVFGISEYKTFLSMSFRNDTYGFTDLRAKKSTSDFSAVTASAAALFSLTCFSICGFIRAARVPVRTE